MKTVFLALVLSACSLLAAPPKPVSISGSQVWTNDAGIMHPNPFTGATSPDLYTNFAFDGVFAIISRSGPHLQVNMGNGELSLVDTTNQIQSSAIDIYAYPNGDSTFTAAIAIGLDTGYGDCVLIDPRQDNGSFPFKFSSSTNNVIAARTALYVIGNAHTNKVIVLGDGTIEGTALAVKTNYLAANFVPIVGYTFFVGSNNAVYSVSTTKTNLISAP